MSLLTESQVSVLNPVVLNVLRKGVISTAFVCLCVHNISKQNFADLGL